MTNDRATAGEERRKGTDEVGMDARENMLRAIRFERPETIPMVFHINEACWHRYEQEALCDLMESHGHLFPGWERPTLPYVPEYAAVARAGAPFTDSWGCVWETSEDGIVGVVTGHPLADWEAFRRYEAPDPERFDHLGPIDWEEMGERAGAMEIQRSVRAGDIGHGHTFLRLCALRGYENLLFDMADEEPRLWELIGLVEGFNAGLVRNYIERAKVEILAYPEDLGMQAGPMISPEHFRKYIKPSYKRIMAPALEGGLIVHMHSDGDIRTLADDLIEDGVEVMNLQDLVNGIAWIREKLWGKVCIDLDIDRQRVTARGTPSAIDGLIREEVERLGSREGGLMMIYGLYPGVPIENVKAVMDAMERYAGYYA